MSPLRFGPLKTVGPRLLAAAIVIVVAATDAMAQADGFGPFPVRNFQPFNLLFLGMFADRAKVIAKRELNVRVEMANTASIFNEHTSRTNATIKFEQLRPAVFLRYGLTDRLEVGMEIPALYRYEGFMDGIIEQTERATAGLSPARRDLKNSSYAFSFARDGQNLFSGGNNQLGLGDITLISKYQALGENEFAPAVAMRFAVKVPSGDRGNFFGSGHADVGLGLAAEKHLADRWILYANLSGVFPTGTVQGLTLNPIMTGIMALEYLWSPALTITAQFDYYSSPYHGTGTDILDNGVTEVTAGFSYLLRPDLLWQIYGVENVDFIRGSAADFTLSTVVTWRFRT